MKNKRGFTLIEIISSVTLILLIFSYSLTLKIINYSQARDKIDRFVSDIRYVRNLNLNGRKSYIKLDKEDNSYKIYINEKLFEKVELKKAVKLYSFTKDEIKFRREQADGNTIEIRDGKKIYKITVAAITGRVKCVLEK